MPGQLLSVPAQPVGVRHIVIVVGRRIAGIAGLGGDVGVVVVAITSSRRRRVGIAAVQAVGVPAQPGLRRLDH